MSASGNKARIGRACSNWQRRDILTGDRAGRSVGPTPFLKRRLGASAVDATLDLDAIDVALQQGEGPRVDAREFAADAGGAAVAGSR
jgi:hypothetical protein